MICAEPLSDPPQPRLVERGDFTPGRVESAAHGVAILARDQGLRPRLADVIEARPVLPPDQQEVAEALIGDEGNVPAAALDRSEERRVGKECNSQVTR